MKFVLATVSDGIIDEVIFFDEQLTAIRELSACVNDVNNFGTRSSRMPTPVSRT